MLDITIKGIKNVSSVSNTDNSLTRVVSKKYSVEECQRRQCSE